MLSLDHISLARPIPNSGLDPDAASRNMQSSSAARFAAGKSAEFRVGSQRLRVNSSFRYVMNES